MAGQLAAPLMLQLREELTATRQTLALFIFLLGCKESRVSSGSALVHEQSRSRVAFCLGHSLHVSVDTMI